MWACRVNACGCVVIDINACGGVVIDLNACGLFLMCVGGRECVWVCCDWF